MCSGCTGSSALGTYTDLFDLVPFKVPFIVKVLTGTQKIISQQGYKFSDFSLISENFTSKYLKMFFEISSFIILLRWFYDELRFSDKVSVLFQILSVNFTYVPESGKIQRIWKFCQNTIFATKFSIFSLQKRNVSAKLVLDIKESQIP